MKLKAITIGMVFLLCQIPLLQAKTTKLTTYYPSPYGEYQTLKAAAVNANAMTLGSANTATPADGVLNFKSQSAPAAKQVGDVYYDSSKGFRYCDPQGNWQMFGGGNLTLSSVVTPTISLARNTLTTITLSNTSARLAIINVGVSGDGQTDGYLAFYDMASSPATLKGYIGVQIYNGQSHSPFGFAMVPLKNGQFQIKYITTYNGGPDTLQITEIGFIA